MKLSAKLDDLLDEGPQEDEAGAKETSLDRPGLCVHDAAFQKGEGVLADHAILDEYDPFLVLVDDPANRLSAHDLEVLGVHTPEGDVITVGDFDDRVAPVRRFIRRRACLPGPGGQSSTPVVFAQSWHEEPAW